jgi:hypothetical protein
MDAVTVQRVEDTASDKSSELDELRNRCLELQRDLHIARLRLAEAEKTNHYLKYQIVMLSFEFERFACAVETMLKSRFGPGKTTPRFSLQLASIRDVLRARTRDCVSAGCPPNEEP